MINYNEKQLLAISMIEEGKNICIIGKGGTGKSEICKFIKNLGDNTLFLGPTGMAALNIGEHARTLHSTMMLGAKSLNAWNWGKISNYIEKNRSSLKDFYDKYKRIVFDEFPMIISGLFDSYIKLFHIIYDTSSEILFNGKQIIMLGDVLQLPPIKNTSEPYLDMKFKKSQSKLGQSDIILYNADFKTLFSKDKKNIIHFDKNMRCNDLDWDEVLDHSRTGFNYCDSKKKIEILSKLNERRLTRRQLNSNNELKKLYDCNLKTTLKKDTIEKINNRHIELLKKSENKSYTIRRKILINEDDFYTKNAEFFENRSKSDKTLTDSINYMDDLGGYYAKKEKQGFNIDFTVIVGQRVMYRKNTDELRNGSLGVITDINANQQDDEVETITIKFDKLVEPRIIKKSLFEHPDQKDIKIMAFPIISAFAITTHKLQGQTIDSKLFILYSKELVPYYEKQEHLLYTAISRCKRKEQIYIISDEEITEEHFPVNKLMFDWYDTTN